MGDAPGRGGPGGAGEADPPGSGAQQPDGGDGLDLHAVVPSGWPGRARRWMGRARQWLGDDEPAMEGGTVPVAGGRVVYRMVVARKMAAAVTAWRPGLPGAGARRRIHERVVDSLLGHRSVVPLPYLCTARDDEEVRRFLARSRLALREALDAVGECYELRLHALEVPSQEAWDDLFRGLASRARSARRIRSAPGARASGAFLLPRTRWVEFVEEVADREARDPGLELDVTGPWAPYDFVRFRYPGAGRGRDLRAAEGSEG